MTEPHRSVQLLGFGNRTPSPVVDALINNTIGRVSCVKSHGLLTTLMHHGIVTTPDAIVPDVVLCQLPASWMEYMAQRATVESIRELVISKPNVAVVGFDPRTQAFLLDGDISEVLTSSAHTQRPNAALKILSVFTDLEVQNIKSPQSAVVLVVGGGGREHAIAVQLAKSPAVAKVYCCPGNGGTKSDKIANIGTSQDTKEIVALCTELQPSMVVVGPEAPLVDGLVDTLHSTFQDLLVFGPTQAAAQLEASKAFSKDFLQENSIPTASYKNFTNADEAIAYVKSLGIDSGGKRQVVKASGLAAGKGVLLPSTEAETIAAVHEIMSDKAFGTAGDTCVIEDFLEGPEASCLAFCDGKNAVLLPAAQDHKRANDNDEGLNTGGMGAYAPAPCVTPRLHRLIESYCQETVTQMAARGVPYTGILYAGMLLTPMGPQVLEFNCRFGDPEAQVLLPLLETDLYEILVACCEGRLKNVDIRVKENATAATVVCAAKGYPQSYPKGMQITGLEAANAMENVTVYHAGTKCDGMVTRCSGGRVLAVTGVGSSLKGALDKAYKAVKEIDFVKDEDENDKKSYMHRRTDIGRRAIQKKLRIGILGSTRGTASLPIIEGCSSGVIHAEISAVLSNKETAPILEKGRLLGPNVMVKALSAKGLTREQFDAKCTAELIDAGVDLVLLIGYMRILSKPFTDTWKGRCLNVHPSLLPKHAGGMDLAVHQAVIDAKEAETGCTIHQVTEEVDGGPIILQKRVKVDPTDTAESLKAKVQPLEGQAFVEAIQMIWGQSSINYSDAGVNIDAGNKLVDLIKPYCKGTRRAGCDADLGGFGGLFDLKAAGFDADSTVLIGATDGVGTKLKIAQTTNNHSTIGIDLVAMCVNDLIVAGGEPLFFLDYFATGRLDVEEAADVVKGIADGCRDANCGLIGGETAEMPSMYAPGDYDLAGFAVGAVDREQILPRGVSLGDTILGLESSGIHSNGYSLVRKLVEKEGLSYESPCPWAVHQKLGDILLAPTKIYVRSCLPLLKAGLIKAMAHITGGGLLENLPRSLPDGHSASIEYFPDFPPVFRWLQQSSGLDNVEMFRTFNCGIGMVLIVSEPDVDNVKELLAGAGEACHILGKVVEGNRTVVLGSQLVS